MPRGVKGSGTPKKPATARPSIDAELDAIDSRVPTCPRDSAPLQSNGECASCKARAAHFKELQAQEAAARRCGICNAPAQGRYRGKRLCPLCRALSAREKALGIVRSSRS